MKNVVIFLGLIVLMFSCKDKKESDVGTGTNSSGTEIEEASEYDQGGWVELFDGKTFNGWHTYLSDSISDQWKIEDGVMYYEPDPEKNQGMNNLVTDKKFESFELSLEWKISVDGNSGVFYGVLEDEKYVVPYMTAPEIQIRDYTNIPEFSDHKQMSGAIFGIVGPENDVSRKAGEWNRFLIRIDHKKNEGSVVLNGKEIISYPVNGVEWESLVENSKFKGWEGFGIRRSGNIGLQDHAYGVWFRNIRIREL
ncbi:3-keto-disaccharide hydrolase [Lutimonas zeaxanthinifaciens]|uniref:3-keto-disaccharide hydrolase n=1 Tax=Lutimonas zeaxanthinifaciens TaxID=3060215 RepID=UPI00265CC38A|nr:DUF1080 domain-containing protein [Lutimonas sp. YSD2104]WKK66975.1 DUF1080 domain-containing protein [Lutimonas sp. YSD2104]